jgi:5-(carboxyamino)imidazole ribonucleotide synthase
MSNHKVLGIIGGGQLGSMLCQAASKINIKTKIYCDDKDAPAQNYADQFICGSYDDENKILEFANEVDVVTFEFENIPIPTLERIKTIRPVFPDPNINFIIQDRSREKKFINDLGIKTVDYKNIKSEKDLENTDQLIPGILKTTTLGYDGKGQVVISKIEDLKAIKLDNHFILEKKINLKKEISVIISRYQDGNYVIYEPIENIHKDQILDTSTIPSTIDEKINNLSKDYTQRLADKLNYVGTMCVEYFIDEQNNLLVNEIAPRVHNSGHLTINAYNVSQFESHVRAVCNLEKEEPQVLSGAVMKNIIGDEIFDYRKKKLNDNEFFFDYLKKEAKPKRKMGHLTTLNN